MDEPVPVERRAPAPGRGGGRISYRSDGGNPSYTEQGMVTREDLESFLIRMDLDYSEVDEGMFLVRSRNGGPPIVIHHSPPLLLVRLKVMDLPDGGDGLEELYRTLLVLNATDVVHGAYGIEEGELILSDTLELETLDFVELQASLESVQMAASAHLERIRSLAPAAEKAASAGEEG